MRFATRALRARSPGSAAWVADGAEIERAVREPQSMDLQTNGTAAWAESIEYMEPEELVDSGSVRQVMLDRETRLPPSDLDG